MINILHFSPENIIRTDIMTDELIDVLKDPHGWVWVDIAEEPVDSADLLLHETFQFHPLAIEDAIHDLHTPKIDDWETYIYLVLHAAQTESTENGYLSSSELDIFLGKNYLVTYQTKSIPAVERVWRIYQQDERLFKRGPSLLLARLADELVFSYTPVVDSIEEILDKVEDEIFEEPTQETLGRIFQLKRVLLKLVRVIAPQRDVINRLGRDGFPVLDPDYQIFFRDVYDHLSQIYEMSESRRELVNSAMDTYLSAVNNRMNEVMKTLAIFTALFMPITFMTGFFGMNFFQPAINLNPWTGTLAFSLTLVVVLAVPVSMFVWMKRRGWF